MGAKGKVMAGQLPEPGTLLLNEKEREGLWRRLLAEIERYIREVPSHRVTAELDPEGVRSFLAQCDFQKPLAPKKALDLVVEGFWRYQTHTPHPSYFGLFNPAPTPLGIAADALVAAFNPQLAAWSHSPFAIETERHLVRALGSRFGFDPEQVDGAFASGGAEANHTALLTALARTFPEFLRRGVRALTAQPVLYVSAEGHHTLAKAARLSGLGTDAVREVPVDGRLRMDPEALAALIAKDRGERLAPFLVVATAGTTSAGVIDPLPEIVEIARAQGLWLHMDAAWGGAAVLLPELRHVLQGIEQADSITFDAHKWLSVPMGAGLYLTRHPGILERTFRIAAGYMPQEAKGLPVVDPYAHSIQWSRRFIGLKVFLSLLVAGWEGYETVLRHQVAMGERLREELQAAGWEVVNETPLPVVCFADGTRPEGRSAAFLEAISGEIVRSGRAWISTVHLPRLGPALRACITNYRTGPEEIIALVRDLGELRERVGSQESEVSEG